MTALIPKGKLWFSSYESFVIFSGTVHKGPLRCKHCSSLLLIYLMAWLVPSFLSLLLTHTPVVFSQCLEALVLQLDCLLWCNGDDWSYFLFDLTNGMNGHIYPSVPLEPAPPGNALLRVAVVGAGVWTLLGSQSQRYFWGDLKENTEFLWWRKKKEKHHGVDKGG